MKRAIKWFVINGAGLALVIYGLWNGNDGIKRIIMFMAWTWTAFSWALMSLFIIAAIAGKMDEVAKGDKREKARSVPGWFSLLYDIVMACLFVYQGWVWTGLVWLTQQVPEFIITHIAQTALDKQKIKKA